MFTEIAAEDSRFHSRHHHRAGHGYFTRQFALEQFNRVRISFHVFPEQWDDEDQAGRVIRRCTRICRSAKMAGNCSAYEADDGYCGKRDWRWFFFLPAFLAIAFAVKATSKGPIFFRQRRIGQQGKSFVFLKFRSMHVNNDAAIHKAYVQKLIAGKAEKQPSDGNGEGVYKLTHDPRITRVGAFLRKTSLDELPQFINVLKGEMSLVGPRPPIPYEVEAYDIWHRRRLLEAKPGITGLWQVSGRSRVKFDDMVRLDLHYARTWSPWTDVKILLRTPGAVVLGRALTKETPSPLNLFASGKTMITIDTSPRKRRTVSRRRIPDQVWSCWIRVLGTERRSQPGPLDQTEVVAVCDKSTAARAKWQKRIPMSW